MKNIHKLAVMFCITLIMGVISPTGYVFASEVSDSNTVSNIVSDIEVTTQPNGYIEALEAENAYAAEQINIVKNSGYTINPTVYTVENNDVISYKNDSGTVNGMIQISDEVNSHMVMVTDSQQQLDYMELNIEGQNGLLIDTAEDGSINMTKTGIATYAFTPGQKSLLCNIVISLSGHGIGAIYTAVALALGGLPASIVVGIINTIGWAAFSDQVC